MDSKYIVGIIIVIIVIIGSVIVFAGIGRPQPETINVVGSTSVHPTAERLAEAYMQKNPYITIHTAGPGTGEGIKSAKDGTADIGTASRDLKEEEKPGLNWTVIGRDGIATIVHPENNVSDLTKEQIRGIYLGEITNWREVGGADATINVVTREEGSGTRGAFEDIVMDDESIKPGAIVQGSTGSVMEAVRHDPNAIGYASLAYLTPDVKALSVGGVTPSPETVLDGTYEIQRPFLFLTRGEPTGAVKAFIDWVLGPEGQTIIKDEGLVPVG
ncbi:MAG: phosphate ABC transporter substrate-binding protein [Methanobacterium sp.]|jgi:phosphate transport system substrate-binding protein